jgi:hypothetical protein
MLSEKNSVVDIKSEVWTWVARYAYEGDLEEKMETIPETIIPGPHAQFRCCIYREREIVRQRVNMMMDKYWKRPHECCKYDKSSM